MTSVAPDGRDAAYDFPAYWTRISVPAGGESDLCISTEHPEFDVEFVRLTGGVRRRRDEVIPHERVSSNIDGHYVGRRQELSPGSFAAFPGAGELIGDGGTFEAWIWPTLSREASTVFSAATETGVYLALGLTASGSLALWCAMDGTEELLVDGHEVLRSRTWYHVILSLDWSSKTVVLWHRRCYLGRPVVNSRVIAEGTICDRLVERRRLLRDAALAGDARTIVPGYNGNRCCFNGKIDQPRLYRQTTPTTALNAIDPASFDPLGRRPDLLGAWHLFDDAQTDVVPDTTGNGYNGRLVNLPTRAVTGCRWTGSSWDATQAPAEYSAAYFHEDDLGDANWGPTATLRLGADVRSGVYAAKISAGSSPVYVPLFVTPRLGMATADVVLIMPALTHAAYANFDRIKEMQQGDGALTDEPALAQDDYIHGHGLLSTYDLHTDGSGVCLSSLRRPIANLSPRYYMPTHGPWTFSGDMCVVEWLERSAIPYDIVTDFEVHRDGAARLREYSVVLTGAHPEYWTAQMLDGLEGYLESQGRFMYLGGNGLYWVTGYHENRPWVVEVRRGRNGTRTWNSEPGEEQLESTGEPGGLWRYRGRSPARFVGVEFTAMGFTRGRSYTRTAASFETENSFAFEGVPPDTELGSEGLIVNAAAGFEIDRCLTNEVDGTVTVLASATGFDAAYQPAIEDLLVTNQVNKDETRELVRSDLTLVRRSDGGVVFSAGSIAWSGALTTDEGEPTPIGTVTRNVLERFRERKPI